MHKSRIQVVEDDRLTAADLECCLEGLGYRVVANVASGEQAIASAVEIRPNLVIMDIRLRGRMNGIEAGSLIREQWGIPAVYLSACVDEARECGCAYIRKPFTVGALRSVLESVLSAAA
ncbi:MAG: response regulator [Bryobacteraceae bacterium]